MAIHEYYSGPGDSRPSPPIDPHDDEFSLEPLFRTLWGYRRFIAATIAGVMVLFAVVLFGLYLRSPVERLATVQFRLLFDGADNGKYPNGTAFSSADIISTPVLTEVFGANELQRFGEFQDFKNAVFIVESNPEIDLLSYEYQAKLTDPKLTPVDRARIEEEFRKKRESLTVGYSLSFRRWERTSRMPGELMSKVLEDTLAGWARQAAERKGALNYNISVLSRNILPSESIEAEDYVVVVDILRSKILRILSNIDKISTLPGAAVARTGKERISLAEVRANLEDVLRFKVQPLIGMIRSTGLSKDPQLAVLYLENQLFQNKLESNQATGTVRTLQDSLRQYMQQNMQAAGPEQATGDRRGGGSLPSAGGMGVPALIPQFGESFLDRLVAMSTQNNDVRFRQDITERVITEGVAAVALEKDMAYYEDLITALRGVLRRGGASELPEVRQRAAALVKARSEETLRDILRSLDQVNAIYEELSAHNLNPNTLLYKTTAPFTIRTSRALGLRAAALYAALVFIFSLFLVPAGCLVYDYFRRWIAGATGGRDVGVAKEELADESPTPAGAGRI